MPPSASLSCNVDRISGFSGVILLFCGASLRGRSDGEFISGFETRDTRWCVASVQFAAFFGRVFGVSHSSSSHEFDRQYSGRPPFAWFGTKHATQNNGPVSHFLVLVLCFYLISSERAFLFCYHTHHTHLGE